MTNDRSIRFDWYVVHAPSEIPFWFHPRISTPKPEPYWTAEEHKKANRPAHNQEAIEKWEQHRERERLFQWPIYWAAEMIRRVEKFEHEPHAIGVKF